MRTTARSVVLAGLWLGIACGDDVGGGRDGGPTRDGSAGDDAAILADADTGRDLGPAFSDGGASEPAPGGFLESTTDVGAPRFDIATLAAGLPAAGVPFTFPEPYGTEAVRLTGPGDCGGADCVRYLGYSYWRNINDHVGDDHLLIVLGLDSDAGGSGLTLLRVDKSTLAVESLGAVLEGTGLPLNVTGEGVYFSATMPHALYVHSGGRLLRVDVMTKEVETVFDVGPEYGEGHLVWQHHTSDDDRVHSFSLRDASYADVGCAVYFADTGTFRLYEPTGTYDECQIDRSGRWLVIKDDVDGVDGEDNRIIDLETGTERILLDRDGAAGHSDNGHGTMVAADNYHGEPGAYRVWDFTLPLDDPANGVLVYHDTEWGGNAGDHVSHTNARPDAPPERQFACNSRLWQAGAANPRDGEIVCYRLDGSLDVLVVAPTLSDRDAPGGRSAYASMPKGNLDVTGRWFVWTTNMASGRLDAFLVRVPAERLLDP